MSSRCPATLYAIAAPEDEEFRARLLRHLGPLVTARVLAISPDPMPGESLDVAAHAIANADIVLVLLSADLLALHDNSISAVKALFERVASGRVVVPVHVRHCLYGETPFSALRSLPLDGTPVTSWQSMDEAFTDIAQSIGILARHMALERNRAKCNKEDAITASASRRPPVRLAALTIDELRETHCGGVVGGYTLLRHIESTAYWGIWHALDERGAPVTLKMPHYDTYESRRAAMEARTAAALRSPYVHQLIELLRFEPLGRDCLVYEALPDYSLNDVLRRRRILTQSELAPIVEDVLEGLSALHDAGIVHRVLTPGDIFLCPDANQHASQTVQRLRVGKLRVNIGAPRAKIFNFGAAQFLHISTDATTISATSEHTLLATLDRARRYHIAPEVALDRPTDERADIYAVASIVFTALTGTPPARIRLPDDQVQAFAHVFREEPPSLRHFSSSNWNNGLVSLVSKGLARSPKDRFSSAREMLQMWRSQL